MHAAGSVAARLNTKMCVNVCVELRPTSLWLRRYLICSRYRRPNLGSGQFQLTFSSSVTVRLCVCECVRQRVGKRHPGRQTLSTCGNTGPQNTLDSMTDINTADVLLLSGCKNSKRCNKKHTNKSTEPPRGHGGCWVFFFYIKYFVLSPQCTDQFTQHNWKSFLRWRP